MGVRFMLPPDDRSRSSFWNFRVNQNETMKNAKYTYQLKNNKEITFYTIIE
jgi:hypothetical protein